MDFIDLHVGAKQIKNEINLKIIKKKLKLI